MISTTLYSTGINDITFKLKPPIKAQLCGRYITITCSEKNVHSINEHLHTAIFTGPVKNYWLTIFSQGILFTRKNKFKLHLNNFEIEFIETIKILGLMADEEVSWAPYL